MVLRLFLGYVIVELAVLIALVATIGFGWTVMLLLGAFVVGVALAGSQLLRQFAALRSGLTSPRGAVTDGALVAMGTVLVVIPGLATSAAGLLLLLPPTRAAARPVVTAAALRGFGRRAPLITVTTVGAHRYASGRRGGNPDFIDGEVIDVVDAESPALTDRPQ